MIRRPMCLICLLLMLCIWLLGLGDTAGVSSQKDPKLESLLAAQAICRIYGRVSGLETSGDVFYIYLSSSNLVTSTEQFSKKSIRIKSKEKPELAIGNRVCIKAKLRSMSGASNPGQFDTAVYFQREGIDLLAEAISIKVENQKIDKLRDGLYRFKEYEKKQLARIDSEQASLFSAILLGDKSDVEDEVKENYRMSGIIHLLSISGTHLGILGMGLFRLLNKTGLGRKLSGGIAGCFLILYGILTGNGISTMRAIIMFCVYIGAIFLGRSYDLLSGMALAAILLLMEQPGYLYESSFLLSFGAVTAIGAILPLLEDFPQYFQLPFAIFLIQLPLLAWTYYEIPLFSIPVNLFAVPLLPIVLISGLVGLLIGHFSLFFAVIAILPGHLVLQFYDLITNLLLKLPLHSLVLGRPRKWQFLAYFLILGLCLFWRYRRWKHKKREIKKGKVFKKEKFHLLRLLPFFFAMLFLAFPLPTGFSFTMLDVGQGDSMVISTASGHHYLLDGGSSSVSEVGKYRIIPYLKYQGIRKMDGIFLTHGDDDHVNGILEMLEMAAKNRLSIKIKKIFLPVWMRKCDSKGLAAAARKAGIPVFFLEKGDRIKDGETEFYVLHPDLEDYEEDENGGSLTMKVKYKELSLLLTGDLNFDGEEKILGEDLDCDVLKVGHHGSKSSSSENFLKQASPILGLISCSENNRYGHPSGETLERLKKEGTEVLVTKDTGAITLRWKKGKLIVEKYLV